MDFYKTIKTVATVGLLTALPTICEPSCAYHGNKAYATEIKKEVKEADSERVPQISAETIESIL